MFKSREHPVVEWPCTCLPAPFDQPCDGCRRNAQAEENRKPRPLAVGFVVRGVIALPLFVVAGLVGALLGACLGPTGEE